MARRSEKINEISEPEVLTAAVEEQEPDTETVGEISEPEVLSATTEPDIETVGELRDPNIIFVGKRPLNGEWVESEPPASLIDGNLTFSMPDAETQKGGFYRSDAVRIIRAFPGLYKRFVKKGDQ